MIKNVSIEEIKHGIYKLKLESKLVFSNIESQLLCDVVFKLEENERGVNVVLEKINKFIKEAWLYDDEGIMETVIYDGNIVKYSYEERNHWNGNTMIELEGKEAKEKVENIIKKTIESEMYHLLCLAL